ncbi:hypothetical protein ACFSTA_02515 [Ornithinibacillus salinisoli]|uniref:Uncharacterized protein n=1 Tax=Ornithinibacillus salinisoli TaxID=1848459 RepID=A0ABW4VVI6_9BACI
MNERKVYLILTDTGTLFTKMIKLFTNKPYNHASISFDPNLCDVYSFGRKEPTNPFIGGFVKEDIRSHLFQRAECAVYSCSISDDQYYRMYKYIKSMEEQRDLYHYNFLGLFGVLLNKPIKRSNAFFCSEFVASVMEQGDITEVNKPTSLITPHDLTENEAFELLYQGKLAYMNNPEQINPITEPTTLIPVEL